MWRAICWSPEAARWQQTARRSVSSLTARKTPGFRHLVLFLVFCGVEPLGRPHALLFSHKRIKSGFFEHSFCWVVVGRHFCRNVKSVWPLPVSHGPPQPLPLVLETTSMASGTLLSLTMHSGASGSAQGLPVLLASAIAFAPPGAHASPLPAAVAGAVTCSADVA